MTQGPQFLFLPMQACYWHLCKLDPKTWISIMWTGRWAMLKRKRLGLKCGGIALQKCGKCGLQLVWTKRRCQVPSKANQQRMHAPFACMLSYIGLSLPQPRQYRSRTLSCSTVLRLISNGVRSPRSSIAFWAVMGCGEHVSKHIDLNEWLKYITYNPFDEVRRTPNGQLFDCSIFRTKVRRTYTTNRQC